MMMNTKILTFFLLISLVFVAPSYADPKGKKIEWSEVPLIVQQIFTQHAQGREILKVKKEKIVLRTEDKQKNKTTLYLARVKKADGKKFWITSDINGQLIDVEDEETEEVLEDLVDKKHKKNKKDS
jgi:hypothetical protein